MIVSIKRMGFYFCLWIFLSSLSACENFLDVDPLNSKIPSDQVFADDVSATAAISGLYLDIYLPVSFAGGSPNSIVSLAGLSADELHNNLASDPQAVEFEQNNLNAANSKILSLWTSMYKGIFQANAIIEGLDNSSGVSLVLKDQLRGEALFVRAFCHFYLINCFGDVPLVVTTDYKINAKSPRVPTEEVYDQIETDLLEAEALLTEAYPTSGKVRPNKFTATAMLSRLYLYRGDWQRAEDKSTNVISKIGLYNLLVDLNSVFLANSSEAIWQLKPRDGSHYTTEGYYFSLSIALSNNVLNETVISAFETNDKRRLDWVTTASTSGGTRYLPAKYKKSTITPGVETNEYSMVFRLAEQYLIRAEARAMQGKLIGINSAEADLNVIRTRAGLPNTTATSEAELLLAIEQERRLEFLAEWGHRWFDLKRWGRANTVLGSLKPGWSVNDQLYPLPQEEMRRNTNLKPQNSGY